MNLDRHTNELPRQRWLYLTALLLVCTLALSGCTWFGSDDGDDDAGSSGSAAATATSPARSTATATREPSPTPSPTREPSPTPTEALSEEEQFLQDVADRWAETDTVHFELDIDGTVHLDANNTIELESAGGDLARPDRAAAEADISIGFADFDVSIIVIGDDAYMTNFLNGDWERAPGGFDFNPALLFDDSEGIANVLREMREPELLGTEQIDGREAQHTTGLVSQGVIDDLVAGSLTGNDIRIDVWADAENNDLLRITLAEPGDDPVVWAIDFSNHNRELNIQAPDL